MRILLEFEIDCHPDDAWAALHNPAAVRELYGGLITLRPISPVPLPATMSAGTEVTVETRLFGFVPNGTQVIRIADHHHDRDGHPARTLQDKGEPLTGPLALLESWNHEMTITESPRSPQRTRWIDSLTVTGWAALLFLPVLRLAWAWRQRQIIHVAPGWRRENPLS